MTNEKPTAGIIIIGDEILKGQTQDTNSNFLCSHLYSLGVKVKKISVVGDDVDEIATEISNFATRFTHVITAGGIGPTHDDITFESVGKAFGEKLIPHPDLVRDIRQYFGEDKTLDSPELKMAHVPPSAKLIYGVDKKSGKKYPYPLVTVRNVCLFPGIPKLMERSFISLKEELFGGSKEIFLFNEIFLNKLELDVADVLNQFVAKYKDQVQLGSYPDWDNNYFSLKLTLEGSNQEMLDSATEEMIRMLPEGSVVLYEKDPIGKAPVEVYKLAEGDDPFAAKLRHSIQVVEEAIEKYPFDDLYVGFNGGKDCTALLHLFSAVIRRKNPNLRKKLPALYVDTHSTSFEDINEFIELSKKRYNLDLTVVKGKMKVALAEFKTKCPHVKAVLMGTRRTDPYSDSLQSFSPTDNGWPEMTRVNPLLDWSYHDIWKFIRTLCVPYSQLYDRGFTSLGGASSTEPNQALKYVDERGREKYYPAYMLKEGAFERRGRHPSTSSPTEEDKPPV